MLAQTLIAASAAIALGLGSIHLLFTFTTNKFSPRDAELEDRLRQVSPVITRETTMWKCWVGFNASHSMGAILFGLIYGYLSLFHYAFLLESEFLVALGAAHLAAYMVLGKLYWFSVPFRGLVISSVLYVLGFAMALT